jgi:hypothetical protein
MKLNFQTSKIKCSKIVEYSKTNNVEENNITKHVVWTPPNKTGAESIFECI